MKHGLLSSLTSKLIPLTLNLCNSPSFRLAACQALPAAARRDSPCAAHAPQEHQQPPQSQQAKKLSRKAQEIAQEAGRLGEWGWDVAKGVAPPGESYKMVSQSTNACAGETAGRPGVDESGSLLLCPERSLCIIQCFAPHGQLRGFCGNRSCSLAQCTALLIARSPADCYILCLLQPLPLFLSCCLAANRRREAHAQAGPSQSCSAGGAGTQAERGRSGAACQLRNRQLVPCASAGGRLLQCCDAVGTSCCKGSGRCSPCDRSADIRASAWPSASCGASQSAGVGASSNRSIGPGNTCCCQWVRPISTSSPSALRG